MEVLLRREDEAQINRSSLITRLLDKEVRT